MNIIEPEHDPTRRARRRLTALGPPAAHRPGVELQSAVVIAQASAAGPSPLARLRRRRPTGRWR